jgi:uncharacterized protein (DUF779 family)
MAELLVLAASPEVAPIDGALAVVLAALRRRIGELLSKLSGGCARGGSVRRGEEDGVKNLRGEGLYL